MFYMSSKYVTMQKTGRVGQQGQDQLGSADPNRTHHSLVPKDDSVQGIRLVPTDLIQINQSYKPWMHIIRDLVTQKVCCNTFKY